jgi:uncharacterized protein involved in exopolysaccharide biosynthesis
MHPSLPLLKRPEPEWAEAYRVSDFARASARRWKLVLLMAAGGFGAAYAFCWLYPDSYISYAQLLFLPPQVSEKYVESNISLHADQRVSALTQMIGSHVIAGRSSRNSACIPGSGAGGRSRIWSLIF